MNNHSGKSNKVEPPIKELSSNDQKLIEDHALTYLKRTFLIVVLMFGVTGGVAF
ncbi:hypothetical protein [Aliikangiella marina]|uniref:hypothetical protein n=1 Tax=Aliikangiella marina TaxID=1712262 RepID=UPI00163D7784|nr:hypothetical protein [Aliikangiella marina]